MKLSHLGIFGSLSLLSYGAMVLFSPLVCLFVMFAGAIGTNVFPKNVFGIFERMSTFSAVIFNAVLGWYLYMGKLLWEGDRL